MMVTLNHTMLYGLCMVHVTLVTSKKRWNNLTKNSLHGETLKSTRHGKKTIFKETQSVRE